MADDPIEGASTTEILVQDEVPDTPSQDSEEEVQDLLSDPNLDKVGEYFKLKGVMRTLRNDLKDLKIQLPEYEELNKLTKRAKELRDKLKDDEQVKELTEKLQTTKERLELLKELIRIDLLETAREEVKREGRKLRIINILREMKDEDEKKKGGKPARKFFR